MLTRILGIDPGIAAMGYGIIEEKDADLVTVDYGFLSTPADQCTAERLRTLYWGLIDIIERHQPTEAAIEYFVGRNLKTALLVGQARGVAVLAAANKGLAVADYTPLEVKQHVSGYGHGGKTQVQEMVRIQLGLESVPEPDHAADALAVAICHMSRARLSRLLTENR